MAADEGADTADATTERVVARLSKRLDERLDELAAAKAFSVSVHQTEVFQIAETLMGSAAGLAALYERAPGFDAKQVFSGGPWADIGKLQPPLVKGSLVARGVYPVVETLSELRLLSIATGRYECPAMSAGEARDFLNEIMALNLEYLFPGDTEQERIEGGPHRGSHIRLFGLIAEELGLTELRGEVVEEIEEVCAQRPLVTENVRQIIRIAARIPRDEDAAADDPIVTKLDRYRRAISGTSPLSRAHPAYAAYRNALSKADASALEAEAEAFAGSMRETGLVSPHHAILVRRLRGHAPELLPVALDLNELGVAELNQNAESVANLIKVAVVPGTAQKAVYGLRGVLQRGLLSRQEVRGGLLRLVSLDLQPAVKTLLLRHRARKDGNTANSVLVAGTLAVLGSPLGIGQGRNPTCQAARGISLWAQHAVGYLLELIISAARDGAIEIPFEGKSWRSDRLISSKPFDLELGLDPVSAVLVPHLDRLYDQFMTLAALRPEDGHKWVNPALYGRWVPSGFASVFADPAQTTVAGYEDFVRRFFATHHTSYNDGHPLMYPNPVGLCVTNSHGRYLGPHAVSLQRIEPAPDGELRAYFFNPNNEGRQNWGRNVRPSVSGHGEIPGESSLPLEDFVARIYAFHYNPYEEGDAYAVPDVVVQRITEAARSTWGESFTWRDGP